VRHPGALNALPVSKRRIIGRCQDAEYPGVERFGFFQKNILRFAWN